MHTHSGTDLHNQQGVFRTTQFSQKNDQSTLITYGALPFAIIFCNKGMTSTTKLKLVFHGWNCSSGISS